MLSVFWLLTTISVLGSFSLQSKKSAEVLLPRFSANRVARRFFFKSWTLRVVKTTKTTITDV